MQTGLRRSQPNEHLVVVDGGGARSPQNSGFGANAALPARKDTATAEIRAISFDVALRADAFAQIFAVGLERATGPKARS